MLLDDLGTYLQSKGVGTVGSTLFLGRVPDTPTTPADVVVLREYGGMGTIKAMAATPGQAVLEQPAVQVLARSTSYATARAKAEATFKVLDGLAWTSTGSAVRYWVEAQQSPSWFGDDANGRALVGFNCQVRKRLHPST